MAIFHGIQNKTAVFSSLSKENVKSRFKSMTEDCLRVPSPREAMLLLLLTSAGILGNYLSISLFFGVDFIFGSIATMMALRISGTLWGTVVGVAVGSYTILLWGHPYAVVIFGLEAFVAGIFLCGLKKDNAALIDAGFWVVIGMPLVWVFYTYQLGLPEIAVELIMFKQAVNGVFNMTVAGLVLQFTPLRVWASDGGKEYKNWPLQQVLNTLLAGTVLAPILIVTALSSRDELEEVQDVLDRGIATQLEQASHRLSELVATMGKLAGIVASDALYEPEHAVEESASILKSFPEFLGFAVVRVNGTVVASYQMKKELIDRYANVSALALTDATLIWRPSDGRDGAGDSIVVVTPVAEHGICVIGWLKPDFLANKLSALAGDRNWKLDLRDREGRSIASSNPKLTLQDFVQGENPRHLLPANTGLPAMVRWRKSFWVHEAPTDIGDGWSLAIAGSLSGVIDSLQKDTVDKLFLAFVVLALTLLLAPFAVRAVHRPLGQLTLAVRQLTETTTRTDVLWPKGAITEIETLVSGFRAMLDSVNENTAKLRGAEETASKAGAELRALVDTVNGPIFGIDTHGMVNEWNRAAERITGFTKAEVLGRNFVEKFVATEFRGPLKDVLDNALRGRETTNYEIPLYAKSGNSVDILLNLATRRNVAGKIIGAVGVGHPRRGSWHGPLSFETAR